MFEFGGQQRPKNIKNLLKKLTAVSVFFLLANLFALTTVNAAVWTATQSWNNSWESQYTSWVKNTWSRQTFSDRSSAFYGLNPDCADTVYAMRLIFAYQNGLPFEVVDPTSTGRTISNNMSRFDDRAASERPRAFLGYLFNILSTRSLPNDSYPVAVNSNQFRPGIFGLAVKVNHHSWTVKNINQYGVPTFYYSTVGNAGSNVVVLQEKNAWYNPYWVFEGAISGDRANAASHAGYRAFKWPNELATPSLMLSKASLEQYQIPVSRWVEKVQEKIGQRTEASDQRLSRLLADSCTNMQARVPAVKSGWDFVRRIGGRCLNQDEFYQHSTPSRDRRALEEIVELRKQYQNSLADGSRLTGELGTVLSQMFPSPRSSFAAETNAMSDSVRSNYCVINYGDGSASLAELRRRLAKGWMSNNPHDEPARRWGEARGTPSSLAASCSNHNDSWTPNLADY